MFTKKTHAWIIAKYYEKCMKEFGNRGREAFIHATRCYGESRGRRMAQRAIRDGRPLNYGTYMEYAEWKPTEEVRREGDSNESDILSVTPDYIIRITKCPWHLQFKKMGLTEAGTVYCAEIDPSIARGFSPGLRYESVCSLNNADCCLHIIHDSGLKEGEEHTRKEENIRDFSYHCANVFYIFRDVVGAVFSEKGKEVSDSVMEEFTQTFGKEMAGILEGYAEVNFQVI